MSLITGSIGRLLRVTTFTSSGTWTKLNDVGIVNVKVIGGGGGTGNAGSTNGTASSFGSHCTANGGAKGTSSAGGAGGSASGGNINLSGENGIYTSISGITFRAMGYLGKYGPGGGNFPNGASSAGGGGSGGYSEKIIQESSLGATETVTVGSGGNGAGFTMFDGGPGIVIIYEYSK